MHMLSSVTQRLREGGITCMQGLHRSYGVAQGFETTGREPTLCSFKNMFYIAVIVNKSLGHFFVEQ